MLNPRWHKVFRDLSANKTKTLLVVLAIAVGVFAFGGVYTTREILIANMDAQQSAINSSSITLSIPSFDDSLVRWARNQEQVDASQGRALYLVKVISGGESFNLDLYAYPELANLELNKLKLEDGAWAGRHEIMFERTALPLIGARTGDTVVVELPNGRQHSLRVSGVVHDLKAVPASMWPQPSGYITMKTLGWLGLPNTYNQLEMLTAPEHDTVPKLEKVGDQLKSRLERLGMTVNSVKVEKPGEHWGRSVTESIIIIFTAVGLFSLILSGFLVVNTITALLAQQRRHIGIMKAVGGRGKQITALYLTTVSFYGVLALIVALPAGAWLAHIFSGALAGFLNFDIVEFYIPLPVVLLEAVAALVVPLGASMLPILGGVRVTVRESLSNYAGGGTGRGLLERALVRVRGLPRPLLLSIRNTFRVRRRLLLTLSTLTLAGTLFVTVVNVRGSMMAEIDKANAMFNYDVQLMFDGNYQARGVERRADGVEGVVSSEARMGVSARRVKGDGTKGADFPVVGTPPESPFMTRANLVAGRWLDDRDTYAIVVTTEIVSNDPDIAVGRNITLEMGDRKEDWQVVGIVNMFGEKLGWANFDHLSRMTGKHRLASTLYVDVAGEGGESQAAVATALEKYFKDKDIRVARWITQDMSLKSNTSSVDFLVAFLLAMAFLAALIGGLGLTSTMSLNVLERTREIGVMRSIGAADATIAGIVLTEGIIIGMISWAIAAPLSVPLSKAFNNALGMSIFHQPMGLVFSWAGLFAWLGIVMFLSVVASLLPAIRASRMSIRETLAYE